MKPAGKKLYVLIDPRDGRVRYAGATSYHYLSSRLSVHVKLCHKNTSRCAGRSDAARRAASERMTAYWAARRAQC